MIASLVLTSVLLPKPFEIDFALVADPAANQKAISLANNETPEADRKLFTYMKSHSNGPQFAILDGSAPLGEKFTQPNLTVDLSTYESSTYESAVQIVNKRKVMSEQTTSEGATRMVVTCYNVGPNHSGFSMTNLNRSSDHVILATVMPLDNLRSSSDEVPKYKQVGLFVTPQSTHEAEAQYQNLLPNKSQIVVCRWGTQRPTAPNLISFPPPGKFKHYKIGYDGTNWYARLQRIVSF